MTIKSFSRHKVSSPGTSAGGTLLPASGTSRGPGQWYRWYEPYLFILFALTGLIVFRLGPIISMFFISLTTWNPFTEPELIGLQNFTDMMTSYVFWQVVRNSLLYSLIFVPLTTVTALLLAVLLNTKTPGVTVFRVLYFTPVITSAVAIGIVWQWIFANEAGVLNFVLRTMGFAPPSWLRSRIFALPVTAFVFSWQRVGFYMVIYLAGLKNITGQLYEAARIDGAGQLRQFQSITLPLITPTIFFVLIMTVVDSFRNFDIIYTMTAGGPGRATTTFALDIYQNAFRVFRMGYAAAVGVVLLFVSGIITFINFRYRSRWVNYEQ